MAEFTSVREPVPRGPEPLDREDYSASNVAARRERIERLHEESLALLEQTIDLPTKQVWWIRFLKWLVR